MKKLFTVTALLAGLAFNLAAQAEELSVMTSGGFTAAYKILGPKFAAASGNTLTTSLGPSMGKAPEAIPNRLARGEHADVVIMVGYALDDLIKQGKVDPASRVELADSRIGLVVREGAPKPDISSVDSLKKTLLDAKSVAYSDSASGVYIEQQLFKAPTRRRRHQADGVIGSEGAAQGWGLVVHDSRHRRRRSMPRRIQDLTEPRGAARCSASSEQDRPWK